MAHDTSAPVWDVFASCTGDDRDWVRPLVDQLSQRFRVFLDERSIEHGSGACQWELQCAYLAALHGGSPTDRIIVVNPTESEFHIEPVELRDARFVVPARPGEQEGAASTRSPA